MIRLAIAAAIALTACGGGQHTVNELTVTGAWARPTPPGATNGVVYLNITSPRNDTVVAVSVPATVAGGAGMHETMGGSGTSPMANMPEMAGNGQEMTMTPLDSLPVPAGETIRFEPGGKHIMLTDISTPLLTGIHFTLTLTFASGATYEADVVVANNPPSS